MLFTYGCYNSNTIEQSSTEVPLTWWVQLLIIIPIIAFRFYLQTYSLIIPIIAFRFYLQTYSLIISIITFRFYLQTYSLMEIFVQSWYHRPSWLNIVLSMYSVALFSNMLNFFCSIYIFCGMLFQYVKILSYQCNL